MVFNRLCDPTSKLGCLRWLDTVAMPAMPDKRHPSAPSARHGRADGQCGAVEDELARQVRPLVDRDLAVVFYDLTTVRIHGEGEVEDDIRAYRHEQGYGRHRPPVRARRRADRRGPAAHAHRPPRQRGETKTLQGMLATVLQRFPIQRVILVADRGLLSLDNIDALTALAEQGGRSWSSSSPSRPAATDLVGTFRNWPSARTGWPRILRRPSPDRRPRPLRAEEQGERRRAHIAEPAWPRNLVGKLDAQDAGQTAKGRRASDRGAYSRFTRAVAEAELTRFLRADLNADRFSWSGKLALLTNATRPD
jgi:hypothetical protein